MRLADIAALARENGWQAAENAPLAPLTTFRIGGPAELLVTVPDGAAAAKLLCACRAAGVPTLLIGNGSNLLVGDGGVRGVVWRFDPKTAEMAADGETVTCGAGVPLTRLCTFAKDLALTGLEFAFGIPGTAGGAVFMNAGAYGGETAQVLTAAEVLETDGTLHTVDAESLALSYRHSALMESGGVVTALHLRLKKGDAAAIAATMQELMAKRREKQPLQLPSAGSFFKRPAGHFAAALIEQCGLKGFSVGEAAVSEKLAGFVVNKGNATAAEVRRLSDAVIERVREKTGVTLVPEVRFVGEF